MPLPASRQGWGIVPVLRDAIVAGGSGDVTEATPGVLADAAIALLKNRPRWTAYSLHRQTRARSYTWLGAVDSLLAAMQRIGADEPGSGA